MWRKQYIQSYSTAMARWFRHSATNRQVFGSIPDKAMGFLNWPRGSVVVKALRYKSEGRGFDTR
jgi:hypothetical protein